MIHNNIKKLITSDLHTTQVTKDHFMYAPNQWETPMLEYCQLDHREQTSVKFKSKFNQFH